MATIIQKYGGSSVATPEKIKHIAQRVVELRREGHDLVLVVSAMGGTTDKLLDLARQITHSPGERELDMLLSAGERISTAIMCMAIEEAGGSAISLSGCQAGVITDDNHACARILEVRPFRVQDELAHGNVVVIAGFQGASYRNEVTTLGRGGSDTSAVALSAALGADHCDLFSDVDGVYSADPRIVPEATRLDRLGYEEMQELARHGARVLNAQAVEFARRTGIAIYARQTGSDDPGTVIHRVDGVLDEEMNVLRRNGVTGVTGRKDVLEILFSRDVDTDIEAEIDAALSGWDVLSAWVDSDGQTHMVACNENVVDIGRFAFRLRQRVGTSIQALTGLGTVSAVGLGVGARASVLSEAREALVNAGIDVRTGFTTRESVAFVVPAANVEDGQRALHRALIGAIDEEPLEVELEPVATV